MYPLQVRRSAKTVTLQLRYKPCRKCNYTLFHTPTFPSDTDIESAYRGIAHAYNVQQDTPNPSYVTCISTLQRCHTPAHMYIAGPLGVRTGLDRYKLHSVVPSHCSCCKCPCGYGLSRVKVLERSIPCMLHSSLYTSNKPSSSSSSSGLVHVHTPQTCLRIKFT